MMKKIFDKIKFAFKGIVWPKPKAIWGDTIFVMLSATILSSIVWIWVTGVDIVINFIISIF